ncbi:sensor histidine kinase [Planosporangium flavigriseum]|uniref:Anti-sigma regulatory factor n=1 Tax=Planosporangium flavigriseum TaxID=373681 RepID=A0A8J3LND0_9ACTN|nr:sensor histidine kinase [Planosporangium flavigriseum]GIG73693.1 anti-sigma regulatory factor [Planosporangium flavigriseum]
MTASFQHEVLVYGTPDELIAGTVPFVREGLDAGEPVLVAAPPASLEPIRSALGGSAAGVRFVDMTEEGRNPGRIIPGVLHAFVGEYAPKRVRVIGEPIWAGRSAAEYPACVQHEALINLAFADYDAAILCPYDGRRLTEAALADAERTHPVVVTCAGRRDSAAYAAPESVVAAFNRPLADPATPPATLVFDADDLPAVRRFVAAHAGRAGLAPNRIADLAVAVNEVATNAVIHGGGPGTLRVWPERGSLLCEVSDPGQLTDPLAGRIPPGLDSEHGRGLLLVNYLCDLVRVHTDATSTTVRLHMRI